MSFANCAGSVTLDLFAETDALPALARPGMQTGPYIWLDRHAATRLRHVRKSMKCLNSSSATVNWSIEELDAGRRLAVVETVVAPVRRHCDRRYRGCFHRAVTRCRCRKVPPPRSLFRSPLLKRREPANVARAPVAKAATTTTRVELERIDRVVNLVGELVISQAMLGQIVQGSCRRRSAGRLTQILDEVVHHTRELKDSVMSMRAQPVGSVFQRMPRLVREFVGQDRARRCSLGDGRRGDRGRSLDRRSPWRPAHAYHPQFGRSRRRDARPIASLPASMKRARSGLSAEHRGGRIVIEITDDGAGINSDRVLKIARRRRV